MAKQINLTITSDVKRISLFPDVQEDDINCFDDVKFNYDEKIIEFYSGDGIREISVEENGSKTKLDLDSVRSVNPVDDILNGELLDEDESFRKVEEDFLSSSNCQEVYYTLSHLKPNSNAIIEFCGCYKQIDSFSLELEDGESFDPKKLRLIIDDKSFDWGKEQSVFDDIFFEDRMSTSIIYGGEIYDCEDSENCGMMLQSRYVISTDADGKIEYVGPADMDDCDDDDDL